ncbi:hypothetical protein [Methylobacterium sp. ID0610]|uniref:hypothetical protein n=1 Tax=Methylobacterium carpenticola TaxID=3344827 RepID=UPI0036892B1A
MQALITVDERDPVPAAPAAPGRPDERRTGAGAPRLRSRAIEEADLGAVLRLLRKGFADRSEAYWRTGLERHRARPLPAGVPRYGFLLEHEGQAVGVLLTLYQQVEGPAGPHLRCNLSSWYVEPAFRSLGVMLDGYAMRDKTTTYVNMSPAPHTLATHAVRGFRRICRGQFLVVPALSRPRAGQQVRACGPDALALLPDAQARLARDHHSYGCLSLICSDRDGAGLVVLQWRKLNLIPGRREWPQVPSLQVVYRSPDLDLSAWLGAIGRHLLRHHAAPWFVVDADGPMAGAVGRYFPDRAPKLYRGPNPPALADLSYTEAVLFGP